MLAPKELSKFLTKMISNFVNFLPLGITVVGTLAIGVAIGSGFIRIIILKISSIIPRNALTPAVMFISILSHN